MPATGSRRALALFAHPDDAELLCAGTLVLLAETGFRIHLATMSPGDLGSATLDREAIATIRREEARRSAEMIRASCHCLEARDFEIFFANDLLRRATALIRRVDPDLVFTHAPSDYLADHEETSRIVRQACFAAPVRLYDTDGGEPATARIPHLYYADPVELVDAFGVETPTAIVVDISESMAMKELMLQCHGSQRDWLERQHGARDPVASMKQWAATRGKRVGVTFGEGFRQHRAHAFPRTPLLEELLGSRAKPA